MQEIRIEVPDKAKWIIDKIEEAGFEAYVVGGCVRDSLLGREPHDWDITTSATPDQVKQIFHRTIDTGIQHGTVTVMVDHEGFEVTTYRIDGKYEDGRHPNEVTFTPCLEEDLKRRDFTINAMAYNDRNGLIDLFDGIADMEKKKIRCVGNAKERFSEDALRMLRAVRFSAQLGYEIEEATSLAICELADNLKKISAERIQVELTKLVTSPHPDYLRKAYETKMTAVFFPEFDRAMETDQNHPHHCYSVGEHILHGMTYVSDDKILRLSMLFHDLGKPDTLVVGEDGITHFHGHAKVSAELSKMVMRRLKFDNDTMNKVYNLVLYHDYFIGRQVDKHGVRKAMNKIGEDAMEPLFEVIRADILAQSDYLREEKLNNLESWRENFLQVKEEGQCVSLRTLAVKGSDLIEFGMKPGKEMGEVLNSLLTHVLEYPEDNEKEILLKMVKERFLK